MADIDDDRLELLERRLAERVTERVRPALFQYYAIIGTTAIAVLGLAGFNLVSNIESKIIGDIQKGIEQRKSEINANTIETQYISKRTKDIMQRVEEQLDNFQPKAEKLDETIDRINKLNGDSKEFSAINSQELQPLRLNVESLSSQLKTLAEQVNLLNTIATAGRVNSKGEPAKKPQQLSAAIQSLISEVKQADQQLTQARDKIIVFLQFAGGTRKQAESLSAALKEAKYDVPGEDRESGAAGKHEVRYFYKEDEPAAQRLAQDTTSALQRIVAAGRKTPDIVTSPLVSYSGKKPRRGVLELWLEIPPN